jgi:hypothetical protein
MACNACELEIRQKYYVNNNANFHYDCCGYVENGKTLLGIYVGMKDFFHVFNFDYPRICPACHTKNYSFHFPCNNADYFDMNTIDVNLKNKKY